MGGRMLSEQEKRAPSGVGGWLLFLCVVLTFVVPIGIVYQMIVALRSGLDVVGLVYALVYLALATFSFVAGLLLWRIRPNAVTTAKLFLLAQAAFALALYLKVLLGDGANAPDSAQNLVVGILLRPLLFAVVWYSYLTKSKRIQATYSLDYSVVTKKL
jgi:hypothetical protein